MWPFIFLCRQCFFYSKQTAWQRLICHETPTSHHKSFYNLDIRWGFWYVQYANWYCGLDLDGFNFCCQNQSDGNSCEPARQQYHIALLTNALIQTPPEEGYNMCVGKTKKKCRWATFNTKQGLCGEVGTHHQLRSHCPGCVDEVCDRVYPFQRPPCMDKAVNGAWLANNSDLCGAVALEYSVTLNSFIESEALTPLKSAEHPRLKSTQSSAALAVWLCAWVRKRERGAAHVAPMSHKLNTVTYTNQSCAFVLRHPHASCHRVSSCQTCCCVSQPMDDTF